MDSTYSESHNIQHNKKKKLPKRALSIYDMLKPEPLENINHSKTQFAQNFSKQVN